MVEIGQLKFDAAGLIPAVVIDDISKKVLTLAYMNRESLEISMREGRTCFYSRSRQELWRKGETSGNVQHITSIQADCDNDALLVTVRKDGPACHLGRDSCFEDKLYGEKQGFYLADLYQLLAERKSNPKEGSYTSYLYEKGLEKILKKLGEEATEVVVAACARDRKETVYELADLMYHALVLMAQMDIPPWEVLDELASRHVIDKKTKQEKMT